jgi:hypothetical protein
VSDERSTSQRLRWHRPTGPTPPWPLMQGRSGWLAGLAGPHARAATRRCSRTPYYLFYGNLSPT